MKKIINKKLSLTLASLAILTISLGFSIVKPLERENGFEHRRSFEGDSKIDFSGHWEIDTIKSEMDGRFIDAAFAMILKQNTDSIRFERYFIGFPINIESVPMNGESIHIQLSEERVANRSLRWSKVGDTLIVKSVYNTEIPFNELSEKYYLAEKRYVLVVSRRFGTINAKIVKAVYNRKN